MSKQPRPAPAASAIGSCPTIIQIVGRPGTGSLLEVKLGRMHRQTGEKFVNPTAMSRQMREVSDF